MTTSQAGRSGGPTIDSPKWKIDWRLEVSAEMTRLTLREQTKTKWALINLVARLGGRRLLEWNHAAAMRRGEAGMKTAIARGFSPPDHDKVTA